MSYDVSELVDDKVIKVTIHLGFPHSAQDGTLFQKDRDGTGGE